MKPPRTIVTILGLSAGLSGPIPTWAAGAGHAPPVDMGPGIRTTDGSGPVPPSCPAAGSAVERSPGPRIDYLGAAPESPDLCRVRVGGAEFDLYYGIWAKARPGSAEAYPALRRVINGPTGTSVSFDTRMLPGMQWHETIRNDGVEDLNVLGRIRPALKISHYREGFDGNGYRSVVTGWKDMRTGMMIYVNYRHISGHPEAGAAWDPTAIVEPR